MSMRGGPGVLEARTCLQRTHAHAHAGLDGTGPHGTPTAGSVGRLAALLHTHFMRTRMRAAICRRACPRARARRDAGARVRARPRTRAAIRVRLESECARSGSALRRESRLPCQCLLLFVPARATVPES